MTVPVVLIEGEERVMHGTTRERISTYCGVPIGVDNLARLRDVLNMPAFCGACFGEHVATMFDQGGPVDNDPPF
jgi:hypothetical protein